MRGNTPADGRAIESIDSEPLTFAWFSAAEPNCSLWKRAPLAVLLFEPLDSGSAAPVQVVQVAASIPIMTVGSSDVLSLNPLPSSAFHGALLPAGVTELPATVASHSVSMLLQGQIAAL